MLRSSLIQLLLAVIKPMQYYSQAAIFYSSTVNPSTRFINALIYALIVGFGAVRIIQGSGFTVGQLVTFSTRQPVHQAFQ